MDINLLETLKRLTRLYGSVILSSQNMELVEQALHRNNYYIPPYCRHTSYEYLNKFYGVKPLFGFLVTEYDLDTYALEDILYNVPMSEHTALYVLKADYDNNILFQGEYYNWSDFHGFVNDSLPHLPQTQYSLYTEWLEHRTDTLDLGEGFVQSISSKEGFESYINTEVTHNYCVPQVIFKYMVESDILLRIPTHS